MRVRVLVFEGDAGIRDLVVETLNEEGIPAVGRPGAAAEGDDVALRLTPDACDLVVVDLGGTDGGGLAMAQRLVYGGMPPEDISLIASAWPTIAYHTARILGLQTFQKPFPMSDLIDWVRSRREVGREKGLVVLDGLADLP